MSWTVSNGFPNCKLSKYNNICTTSSSVNVFLRVILNLTAKFSKKLFVYIEIYLYFISPCSLCFVSCR